MSRFVRLIIAAAFFGVMFSGMAMALEKPRVLILPFEINAEYDRNYLQTEILKILTDHIQKSGAEVIPGKMLSGENQGEIRSEGIRAGASYVIWGSSTWSGEDQYKITAKILY